MKRGRPPLNDEAATTRIRVRVTEAQRLELIRVAGENGTDMSGVIREAVNEYVSDYRERGVFRRTRSQARPQNVGMAETQPNTTTNTPGPTQPTNPTPTPPSNPAPAPSVPGTSQPTENPNRDR